MNPSGFVDLQVNGYKGIDFSDPATTIGEIHEASQLLMQNGTVGFLATVMTQPRRAMEACVSTIAKAIKDQRQGWPILGIHLEGPFISPEDGYRGSHPAAAVIAPDLEWFKKLQRIAEGAIRLVTLAPESEGAVDFIRAIASTVAVSAGHTACSYRELRRAVEAGLKMATHIGNGCRQTIDRHDNPIVNILGCTELTLSFIPDGIHLPEAFIRMILNARPIEKLIAVSDSVNFAGMEPGNYSTSSGVKVVLSAGGRLSLASNPDVMAGSSSNMFKCMNRLASLGLLEQDELWRVGYFNPLNVLGLGSEDFFKIPERVRFDSSLRRFELLL